MLYSRGLGKCTDVHGTWYLVHCTDAVLLLKFSMMTLMFECNLEFLGSRKLLEYCTKFGTRVKPRATALENIIFKIIFRPFKCGSKRRAC